MPAKKASSKKVPIAKKNLPKKLAKVSGKQGVQAALINQHIDAISKLDLGVLQTCLYCYRELKNQPNYLQVFAEDLGINAGTLLRHISRFEKSVNQVMGSSGKLPEQAFLLFERQRGTKARIHSDPTAASIVESVMFSVAEIVESWTRISDTWGLARPVVRLAMSLAAARCLVPQLARRFPSIWFDVTQTKPQRLMEIARSKAADLVLTEVPRDFTQSDNSSVFDFPIAFIAPRGHWTEAVETDDTFDTYELLQELAQRGESLCILHDEPALYPLPSYPGPHELPKNLRILRCGSTTLCHALVMLSSADAPVVSLTLPQFLTEDDLERVSIIPTRSGIGEPSRIALIRPGKPTQGATAANPTRTSLIGTVEAALIERLVSLSSTPVQNLSDEKWIYHISEVGGKIAWVSGKLVWRVRESASLESPEASSPKVVTGTHTVTQGRDGLTYVVRGRVVRNTRAEELHLVYRARLIGANHEDSYVFSGFCPSEAEFKRGQIFGCWQGVFTDSKKPRADRRFQPASGFAVISQIELDLESLNHFGNQYQHDRRRIFEPNWTADRIISG